jgi:hypothetical protein
MDRRQALIHIGKDSAYQAKTRRQVCGVKRGGMTRRCKMALHFL